LRFLILDLKSMLIWKYLIIKEIKIFIDLLNDGTVLIRLYDLRDFL
jgi:hypothetical protein